MKCRWWLTSWVLECHETLKKRTPGRPCVALRQVPLLLGLAWQCGMDAAALFWIKQRKQIGTLARIQAGECLGHQGAVMALCQMTQHVGATPGKRGAESVWQVVVDSAVACGGRGGVLVSVQKMQGLHG
ncbi:hypothetical protein [Comamonas aquatilis]|uniref:hypothetical protein n=1 Tax=Comamonas aquatilis TaxID=1778406 RepID=UPI0039F12A64